MRKLTLLATALVTLNACSSDDSATVTPIENTANESAAATRARAAINNGFFLSRQEEYGSDGELLEGLSYTLNTDENIIEIRTLENPTVISRVYSYNEKGDVTSLAVLSTEGFLIPAGEEILRVDTEYEDGALRELNQRYFAGNEEDTRTTITYDSEGKITGVNELFLESNTSDSTTYHYENGQLSSISGTDVELPDYVFTTTITLDTQNRTTMTETIFENEQSSFPGGNYNYLYDDDGNISERQSLDSSGNISYRLVYFYEPTGEAVFNLTNLALYYDF